MIKSGKALTENISASNKRIAKNALFLYFRLLFTLSIGLYTSRLVLNILGIVDYGIYNVVGGVVAIFAFLQAALSGSTTRFLNVYMVEDIKKLKTVFNTALIMHGILAIVVITLAETVGLWFVINKLTIPQDRMYISLFVYQFSVLSTVMLIMKIPYDATIIAHEKMNFYALFSIFQAILSLITIFIVKYLPYDKLFVYGGLVLAVSTIITIIVKRYCNKVFSESQFSFLFDKKIFKDMISFFGWDLYGNMSVVLRIQGGNIIQNIFFGPIVNASVAIVSQVQNGLLALGSNLVLAAKPQIIQSYSRKEFDRMFDLLSKGTRLGFYLVLIVSLPLVFYPKYVLNLWLGQVPVYADKFLTLSLLSSIIAMSFSLLIPIIHATGKMFIISFITGSIYLMYLPAVYLLFKFGYNPVSAYYLNFAVVILAGIVNLYIVQKYIPQFRVIDFFKKVLLKLYFIFTISYYIGGFLHQSSHLHPIFSMMVIALFIIVLILVIGVSKEERRYLSKVFTSYIRRII